ncbi:hypothetical protein RD110_11030 [Rhodoferax koreense]|uniref:Uncharacterized protein n=1 Tax=Rhodoferax koreensis TaxID=1842727 RepID=A0A1P8JV64_9BURK|nr:hypothetical protein [Rhodoferax koreense]APW37660.1 hypothetical protein RD110_11030 [Rhodoferax koreense]
MAGLLDFLNNPDAQLGINLLAAGGPSTVPMNIGQRVQGAMQVGQAQNMEKLKNALLQSQIAENTSQDAMRRQQLAMSQRQMDIQNQLLGIGQPATTTQQPGAMPGANITSSAGTAPMPGQNVAGSGGTAPMPAPYAGAQQGTPAAGTLDAMSKQYGIPAEALKYDLVFNGGKGIAAMVEKRGTPDMQVTNGYAYDKNKLQQGFIPGVNTAANGMTSVTMPDGQGGVRVGTPMGALETYGAYQDITNRSGAAYKEGTPTIGPDGRKRIGSVLSNVQPATSDYRASLQNLPQAQGGMTSSFQGAPETVLPMIAAIKDPQERANAYDAYSRQMTNGGPTVGAPGGNVVELSPQEQSRNTADSAYQSGVAKDQVEQRKNIVSAGFSAPSRIAKLQQIDKLLGDFEGGALSDKGVQFASAMNSLGMKVDKNLPNKEAALAMSREIALGLRNPAGGAGMPGAMSDADRNFLSSMTPDIGQTAQGRKQIIQAGIAVETRNQQVADFARKYEAKYGKLDNGFYSQLANWSSANPLFGK